MPLDEFQSIKDAKTTLEMELHALKQKIIETRMASADGEVGRLVDTIRAAMKVIGYAIANLSPEFNRNWPAQDLRDVATGVLVLPDATPFDCEFAHEITKFARECEAWDAKRVDRYVPPPSKITTIPSLAELAAKAGEEIAKLHPTDEADREESRLDVSTQHAEP